ncbi:MAG: hypothetical protein QOH73_2465 [Gaiellaceae bacterium]|nr:hypothetical protein [Gaiellaceae bacterium]
MRRRVAWALVLSALVVVPSASGWSWPVTGQVVQGFNFDRAQPYAAGQQRGIDIAAPPGASVLAPAGGSVTFAGTVPSSGKAIAILSGAYSVTLTQLGSIAVEKGAAVAEGQTVGTVGPAGIVHLGVRVASDDQGYVDPLSLLPAQALPGGADAGAAEEPATDGSTGADAAASPGGSPADGSGSAGQDGGAPSSDVSSGSTDAVADPAQTAAEEAGADSDTAAGVEPATGGDTSGTTDVPVASGASDAPASAEDPPAPVVDAGAGDPSGAESAPAPSADAGVTPGEVPAAETPTDATSSDLAAPVIDPFVESPAPPTPEPEPGPLDPPPPLQMPPGPLDGFADDGSSAVDSPPAPTEDTAATPESADAGADTSDGTERPVPASLPGSDLDPTAGGDGVSQAPGPVVAPSTEPGAADDAVPASVPAAAGDAGPAAVDEQTELPRSAPAVSVGEARRSDVPSVLGGGLVSHRRLEPAHRVRPERRRRIRPHPHSKDAGVGGGLHTTPEAPQLSNGSTNEARPAAASRPFQTAEPSSETGELPRAAALAALLVAAASVLAFLRRKVTRGLRRIIRPHGVGHARAETTHPRGSGVAVCERATAHRPRGRVRRPVGHLRPLPPAEGQRRPHGQRDGRARDTGDGRRGQGRRLHA